MAGNIRGAAFNEDLPYLRKKKGSMGLRKIEESLRTKNVHLALDEIRDMRWYPLSYRVSFLKVLKNVFNWGDDQIYKMALHAPKAPTAQKFFLKYFVSLETAFKMADRYWDRYFDFGRLHPRDMDQREKTLFLDLYDFDADDIMYTQLSGYFAGVARLTGIKEPVCRLLPGDQTPADVSKSFVINWK